MIVILLYACETAVFLNGKYSNTTYIYKKFTIVKKTQIFNKKTQIKKTNNRSSEKTLAVATLATARHRYG